MVFLTCCVVSCSGYGSRSVRLAAYFISWVLFSGGASARHDSHVISLGRVWVFFVPCCVGVAAVFGMEVGIANCLASVGMSPNHL